jgi:hypothetical protein
VSNFKANELNHKRKQEFRMVSFYSSFLYERKATDFLVLFKSVLKSESQIRGQFSFLPTFDRLTNLLIRHMSIYDNC